MPANLVGDTISLLLPACAGVHVYCCRPVLLVTVELNGICPGVALVPVCTLLAYRGQMGCVRALP